MFPCVESLLQEGNLVLSRKEGSQPKEIAPSSSFTCLEPLYGHLYRDNNNDNKKNKIKVKKT